MNPGNSAEESYNRSHFQTRNTVERLFRVWKRRFPCLSNGIALKPEKVCDIIVATAVLHNICLIEHDEAEDFEVLDDEHDAEESEQLNSELEIDNNNAERIDLIDSVFT